VASVSSFAKEVCICGAHEYQGGSAELDYENIYAALHQPIGTITRDQ